jgi:uncharacterized membrane-anchored protein
VTATTAPASLPAVRGRATAAFARVARSLATRAASAARKGGATVLGAAGLASVAVGAGMVYTPAGLIVGGVLAVWFASLLPGGAK